MIGLLLIIMALVGMIAVASCESTDPEEEILVVNQIQLRWIAFLLVMYK